MALNPIVKIIGLGTLAGLTGCTHTKTNEPTTPSSTIDSKSTNTGSEEGSKSSEECAKDFDINAPCTAEGLVCPPPESMKDGTCPPPEEVTCTKGVWELGPMPTCNPPPLPEHPAPNE